MKLDLFFFLWYTKYHLLPVFFFFILADDLAARTGHVAVTLTLPSIFLVLLPQPLPSFASHAHPLLVIINPFYHSLNYLSRRHPLLTLAKSYLVSLPLSLPPTIGYHMSIRMTLLRNAHHDTVLLKTLCMQIWFYWWHSGLYWTDPTPQITTANDRQM